MINTPNYNIIPIKFENEIRRNAKVKILPNDRYKITCFKHYAFREKGYEERKPSFIDFQDVTESEYSGFVQLQTDLKGQTV